ncbi:MAG: SDR family oxidoreductase [Thermoanaerobaculia bacterium]|nr:SDR family oxidoreductase [Thermoanaerobaculia bacterium]
MFDFSDKVAVVTGASGALGSVVARRLYDAGARLALVDRETGRLPALWPEVEADAAGADRLAFHACDLAAAAQVSRTVEEILARFGHIDLVFNIAGAYRGGETVEDAPDESWKLLWEANFLSALHVCRAVVPRMRRQGGGAIVNVGSKASLGGEAGVAPYSIAKTAVVRLTESLAAEVKRDGIRVNVVLPGTLDTPANRHAMSDSDPRAWVAPEALADAMLFLASPQARAVTGAALPVFGLGS